MHCVEFAIELPGLFPYAEWSALFRVRNAYPENSAELGDFVRSMQASAYQFRISSEAVASMIADWASANGQLDFEGKYRQQRDLALFVGASLTSIESAAYACYVTLTQRHPATFPWGDARQRRSYFYSALPDMLDRVYGSGAPLSADLRSMTASPEWKALHDLRNTFTHRTLPSRLIKGIVGPGIPPNEMVRYVATWSHGELRATEAQMTGKLHWVADRLRLIYAGGIQL
jgi:hypothetical protein